MGWTYSLSRLSSGALPFVLLPVLDSFGALAMFGVVAVALVIILALGASGVGFALSGNDVLIVAFGFLTTMISNVFSNVFHIYQA
ncbi:hypothetical protein CTI14_48110, partial [Methylobacterium radiotolerans]